MLAACSIDIGVGIAIRLEMQGMSAQTSSLSCRLAVSLIATSASSTAFSHTAETRSSLLLHVLSHKSPRFSC